jgi:hypothetical protein
MAVIETGTWCPMIKDECVGIKCVWMVKVVGIDKNTGNHVEDYNCAMAWMPLLAIENSGTQRETGAAVESFRNEMVKAQQVSLKVLAATQKNSEEKQLENIKFLEN